MKLTERIAEHLSRLGIHESDSDTAQLLREAKREIEQLERDNDLWVPKLTTDSFAIDPITKQLKTI